MPNDAPPNDATPNDATPNDATPNATSAHATPRSDPLSAASSRAVNADAPPHATPPHARGDVQPTPPLEPRAARVSAPATSAAGLDAVRVAWGHALRELGPLDAFRLTAHINQPDGFDCQSCAWPDPPPEERASLTEYCENGIKVTAAENTRRTIPDDFFRTWSVAELSRQSDAWLQAQGRLTRPLVLREGASHYEPASWDEAIGLVARELRNLAHPDEAAFYTSGRTSNEAAFLYQLFVRQFGTNNLPDCSNMCHESSGVALTDALGVGKGTVTLADLEDTDLVVSIGHNPGTNHPRMLSSLERAKARGAKVIAINPLPEAGLRAFKHPQDLAHPLRALRVLFGPGTPIADLHLPVRVGGDVALLKGLLKALFEEEDRRPGQVVDRAFVREHTAGFEALEADLRAERWDVIVEESGIGLERIREAAAMIAGARRMIVAWAMGLTQQPHAVAAIQQAVNLLLLKGCLGTQGSGALPVRGHSNVQGDRTMGISEKIGEPFLDGLGREFSFEPPRAHGLDTVGTIRAMYEGRVKVFFGLGGNFLSAAPDTAYTAEAMRRCRLTAHVSTKLNRGHLVTGRQAVILPTLGRAEKDVRGGVVQFVTVENSMGVVTASRGVLDPVSPDLLGEPVIVAKLARATLGDRTTVPWEELVEDYDRIRERIARVVPGFERFVERIRQPGGIVLPHPVRDRREFPTPDGRAQFRVHPIPRVHLERDQLVLMTIRSHDQFNTTIYGLDDRYRGIRGARRVVFLNAQDVHELGLEPGQLVDLTSHFRGETRRAPAFRVVPYPIPRRCAAAYFPEANVLVPADSVAAGSRTPTSKFVIITVAPSRSVPVAEAG